MNSWIFQSIANYFDLPKALREAPQHDNVLAFLAVQCAADITPGDTVYLCFGGKRSPGLYATATVRTRPAVIDLEDWQLKYLMKPLPADERQRRALKVLLKIEQLLDVPVARGDIYRLPELAKHSFVRARIGTNFRLTPGQAFAIKGLIALPRALRDPTPAGN
jgi:hypothetical protein